MPLSPKTTRHYKLFLSLSFLSLSVRAQQVCATTTKGALFKEISTVLNTHF